MSADNTKKTDSGASSSKSDGGATSSDSGASAGGGSSSGGGKAPARPISYFSSVSTDEYRDGWNAIFGKPAPANGRTAGARAKRKPAAKPADGGVEVSLSARDLTSDEREVLMAAFRRKAKARRIDLDRRARNGKLRLDLTCRIDKG